MKKHALQSIVSWVLLLSAILLILPACANRPPMSKTFYLMDTSVTVTLYTRDKSLANSAFDACNATLRDLDALWSRHSGTGDLIRLNASEKGVEGLDPRTTALIARAQEISQNTGGAFDITLAPLSILWETCGAENRLPTDAELQSARALVGSNRLSVFETAVTKDSRQMLDLGGIGKGAAISALLDVLRSFDIRGGLISFGSNVCVFGEKPKGESFRVALRDPKDASRSVGTFTLTDGTVLSVSGDYERFQTILGERYHHIIDPKTGHPSASGLSSVAVLCSDGALADALSTALLVLGEEQALAFHAYGIYSFEALLITSDGRIVTTPGLTNFEPVTR
jgi:thiamine biosynthesis lipoprotein